MPPPATPTAEPSGAKQVASAFRYPLPYAFARSHQLLLEDDGEHSTLWHGPTPDASACGEVMRRHTVTALQGLDAAGLYADHVLERLP